MYEPTAISTIYQSLVQSPFHVQAILFENAFISTGNDLAKRKKKQ